MTKSRPVILTCAITGAIHTPSMSDALPVTAEQIAASAIAAAHAGASILHLHARDDADGRPVQTPEAFAPILKAIRAQCDCIINITTGGAPTMSVEDRLRPAATVKPELASLNMGSMNFGLYPMLDRYPDLQHAWERDYLSNRNIIFNNTFGQIEDIITTLSAHDTRFEFECYDTAHLYNLRHFLDRGLVKPPLFIQTVFGLMGGIGAHPDDVAHMKRTADRLFGRDWQWSVLGAGRHQMPIAAMALAQGGHVRVGLEDSLWAGPGVPATSNAQQVETARTLIDTLGMQVATPDQTRDMLGLKGADSVNM
jgi:uncharacterized protein (DUF849 family)